MNKYKVLLKVGWGKPTIEVVFVEKETMQFVYLKNGIRMAKRSEFNNYYDSFDDAKIALQKYTIKNVKAAKKKYQNALQFAKEVDKLTESSKTG